MIHLDAKLVDLHNGNKIMIKLRKKNFHQISLKNQRHFIKIYNNNL